MFEQNAQFQFLACKHKYSLQVKCKIVLEKRPILSYCMTSAFKKFMRT
jgi:hypothetical protein